MAISKNSKMKEIMAFPGGPEVLEKYWPGITTDKQFLTAAQGITPKFAANYPQGRLDKETQEKLFADLEALND